MRTFQKVIKYLAMAFAIFLIVSIIGGALGAVGLFGGLFDSDNVSEDVKTYAVSGNITELDIRINTADFSIKQADVFSVESNLKHLTVKEKGGVLTIAETEKFSFHYNHAMLVLYIPEGTMFEKAEITTGAGKVSVDTLSADSLKLELGAGEVKIDSLTANKKADIDGGTGKITIAGGSLHNLDLDMGVGQLNLTSAVLGNSDFDLGVGESNITLIGNQDDYTIHAEKGIGNITVDGKTVSEYNGIGSGPNNIDISGGIGAIHLAFVEESKK